MPDNPVPVKPERGSPSKGHPRSGHREQRRTALVQAAMRAIRRYGPDVAMEDIASEAGVSKPILYRYFLDKGDLYMAVSETATQHLRTILLSGLESEADPRTLLRLVIETYLTFIEQEPELYRFVVRRSFTDRPLRRDPVTTNAALISGTLATIFRDRLRSLGLDPGGAETWAHAGVGMVQAAGDWWLQHRTLSREGLRDYLLMMAWGALDAILQAGGSPGRMLGGDVGGSSRCEATAAQPPTAKPTRRLSAGPISM
ncbi:MAG TPA: TetR family transcriptional regulator [Pseudonocardiaceae bacterium]|jgi:AcrR family transcriptional regulator|nr:TetR family transcriptional regulator [Pseudonocardiaceae bacterium]